MTSTKNSHEMKPLIDHDEVLAMVVPLFAREPSLAQKLLNLVERKALPDQVTAFFDYLFVISPSPALRTNYNVLRYRLRNMDERDSALRTLDVGFSDFEHREEPISTLASDAG